MFVHTAQWASKQPITGSPNTDMQPNKKLLQTQSWQWGIRPESIYCLLYNRLSGGKWPHMSAQPEHILLHTDSRESIQWNSESELNNGAIMETSRVASAPRPAHSEQTIISLYRWLHHWSWGRLHRCLCSHCGTTNERLASFQLCI